MAIKSEKRSAKRSELMLAQDSLKRVRKGLNRGREELEQNPVTTNRKAREDNKISSRDSFNEELNDDEVRDFYSYRLDLIKKHIESNQIILKGIKEKIEKRKKEKSEDYKVNEKEEEKKIDSFIKMNEVNIEKLQQVIDALEKSKGDGKKNDRYDRSELKFQISAIGKWEQSVLKAQDAFIVDYEENNKPLADLFAKKNIIRNSSEAMQRLSNLDAKNDNAAVKKKAKIRKNDPDETIVTDEDDIPLSILLAKKNIIRNSSEAMQRLSNLDAKHDTVKKKAKIRKNDPDKTIVIDEDDIPLSILLEKKSIAPIKKGLNNIIRNSSEAMQSLSNLDAKHDTVKKKAKIRKNNPDETIVTDEDDIPLALLLETKNIAPIKKGLKNIIGNSSEAMQSLSNLDAKHDTVKKKAKIRKNDPDKTMINEENRDILAFTNESSQTITVSGGKIKTVFHENEDTSWLKKDLKSKYDEMIQKPEGAVANILLHRIQNSKKSGQVKEEIDDNKTLSQVKKELEVDKQKKIIKENPEYYKSPEARLAANRNITRKNKKAGQMTVQNNAPAVEDVAETENNRVAEESVEEVVESNTVKKEKHEDTVDFYSDEQWETYYDNLYFRFLRENGYYEAKHEYNRLDISYNEDLKIIFQDESLTAEDKMKSINKVKAKYSKPMDERNTIMDEVILRYHNNYINKNGKYVGPSSSKCPDEKPISSEKMTPNYKPKGKVYKIC